MKFLTHEEFMRLEGKVVYTEHFPIKGGYSNYSPLFIRDSVHDDAFYETVVIDNCISSDEIFDQPLEPYTIRGCNEPEKMYRIFEKEDIQTVIKNLQETL